MQSTMTHSHSPCFMQFYHAANLRGHYITTLVNGGMVCGSTPPQNISSSGNEMLIKFITDGSVSHRGFKFRWDADQPALCGGAVVPNSGPIYPLMAGSNYTRSTICHWIYSPSTFLPNPLRSNQQDVEPTGGTIVFRAEEIFLEPKVENRCVFDTLFFLWDHGDEQWCGRESNPLVLMVPRPQVELVFYSDGWLTDRGLNVTHSVSNCGGVFSGPSQVIQSPRDSSQASTYSANGNCVWLLEFDEGQQIEVTFDRFQLESSDACVNDYLLIRNGRTPQSPLIWKKCGTEMPPGPLMSMSNYLWIEFHSNELNQGAGFSLNAHAHTLGCGGVFHGANDNITAPMDGSQYRNGVECVWNIELDVGFHAVFEFTNRFEIETSPNCVNDFVQISEFDEENRIWVAQTERLCGRELPARIVTRTSRSRVLFRSDQSGNGDGFQLSWREECGGSFNASEGVFSSPGYPIGYKSNLTCTYVIHGDPLHFVVLKFREPFNVGQGYGDSCNFDNVQIFSNTSGARRLLGKYCEAEVPAPIRARGSMEIVFKSDGFGSRPGFQAEFNRDQCGGHITEEGEVSSPLHPYSYFHNMNCTWLIQAPEGQVIEMKFDYVELEYHSQCRYDYVAVFEGWSLNQTQILGNYCGNHSASPPVTKSRSNKMTIQFKTDRSISYRGFRGLIRFTYGEDHGCGGQIQLSTAGAETQIRSLDMNSDGLYEMDLNCQWGIIGPDAKVLQISFQQFDVEQEVNGTDVTCWDYLEIRDGFSPLASLMGRYCGSDIPPVLTSSGNALWVKFFSDSTTAKPGFLATVRAVNPICGTHNLINVTQNNQILYSPQFPSNYPSSVRCQWILAAPRNYRVWIKLTDFDLERSSGCVNDYLRLTDISPRTNPEGERNDTTYAVSPMDRYRWTRRTPTQELSFCGNEIPHEFFSMSEMVKLQFVSNGQSTGRGFRLEYSLASCNRSYGGTYGRITSPQYPSRISRGTVCESVITAPSGSTVTLYFNVFRLASSQNCSMSSLEVRDGSNPTDRLISRLCGYSIPASISSSGPTLRIRLAVGHYSTTGYDITYTTTNQGPACGGLLFDAKGSVTSPGFPGNHSQLSDCTWVLRVPQGEIIELRFTSLQFGTPETCSGNFVELYNQPGQGGSRRLITRYCGNDRPTSHVGISNEMQIRYVTNTENSGSWRVQFQYLNIQGTRGSSPSRGQNYMP